MTDEQDHSIVHLELTTEIVSAYVARNPVPSGDLRQLIFDVHSSLTSLAPGKGSEASSQAVLIPAVPIKRSVAHDHLVCLEDGKIYKSLKRHLASSHGMTPDEYRSKWGLPFTYPMTAPGYSEKRSALAKEFGLGLNRSVQLAAAPNKRGRKPKEVTLGHQEQQLPQLADT